MKKLLSISVLCICSILFILGYFNALHSDNHATPTAEQAWKAAEKKIKIANEQMEELKLKVRGYETEHSTLMGDAPTTALGMIGKGIMQVVTFWDSWKGIRLRVLDQLRIGAYIQMDVLNHDLVDLDAKRDIAYEAYKLTTSQPEDQENQPEYFDVPEVQAPCANVCGTYFSSEVVGLRYLANAISYAHMDVCGDASATPPGCGDAYWTCNGRKKSGTEEHKPRTCSRTIYTQREYGGNLFRVSSCRRQYRTCTHPKRIHIITVGGSGGVATKHSEQSDEPIDNTPNCDNCTDGCSDCPIKGQCGHTYSPSKKERHKWGTFPCGDATHVGYLCRAKEHNSPSVGQCGHTVYACGANTHVQEQCTVTNSNGDRCTYLFWRCKHPNVPSYGPSHTHTYPQTPEPEKPKCVNGHEYNPNNNAEVNLHKTRTCRYRDCRNTWQKCLSLTPNCSSPRRSGKKCWAR